MANKVNTMSKLVKASQSINKAIEALELVPGPETASLKEMLQDVNTAIRDNVRHIVDAKLTINKESKE